MVTGRYTLLRELAVVMNRIARLDWTDPMRATEEMTLVDIIRRERRRSRVPLGGGAFALLAAPGGPMSRAAPRDPRRRPTPPPTDDPRPGPSGAQAGPASPPRHRGRGRRRGSARPRPPPGFVDLTADDDDEMATPATPPPQVSDNEEDMDLGEEDALLAAPGGPMSRPAPRDSRLRPPRPPTDDPRPGPSGSQAGPASPPRHRGRGDVEDQHDHVHHPASWI